MSLKSSLTIIDNEDYPKLNDIISEIKSQPDAINFLYPVDTKLYPDYLRAINDRPMDVSTISTKLSSKRYHFIQDVFDDFQLIWDNCRIYNKEGYEIYNQADRMEKFCSDVFSKYYYVQKSETKNFLKEFDNNIYDEEAFNDPNYYQEENGSSFYDPYFKDVTSKIKVVRMLKTLNKSQMQEIIENCTKNGFEKYIEKNEKGNFYIHVQKMTTEDLERVKEELNKFNISKE